MTKQINKQLELESCPHTPTNERPSNIQELLQTPIKPNTHYQQNSDPDCLEIANNTYIKSIKYI